MQALIIEIQFKKTYSMQEESIYEQFCRDFIRIRRILLCVYHVCVAFGLAGMVVELGHQTFFFQNFLF